MAKSWSQALFCASLAGAMVGCSTVPDREPLTQSPLNAIHNADLDGNGLVPQAEPPSRRGNPDTYVVFGRRYRVKETSAGHQETGIASWYGWDFHGRTTSSGPPFNMFELTAAHKSLPIPTYVRVTNLENGRSTIVKVNDRGPFIGERVIDLSYAAAARLDMLDQGIAQVEIVALEPYQFLPQLAARRAEQREQLASRAAERARAKEKKEQIAALHFAREKPVAGRTTAQPPATVIAQQKTPSRLAKPVTASTAKPAGKTRLASAAPARTPAKKPGASASEVRLAASTGKPNQKPAQTQPAATGKRSALYVVGAIAKPSNARQLQNRLSSQLQRTVQVESGSGKQYEVRVPLRNPGEARQMATRLASLGVSRSRVVAD